MASQIRRRIVLVTVLAALGSLSIYVGFDSASLEGGRWLRRLADLAGLAPSASNALLTPEGVSTEAGNSHTNTLSALPDLPTSDSSKLPFDLLSLEGQGGDGIHRAVKRAGVWFPIYAPGALGAGADADKSKNAEVPLYITSATPPATPPNQRLSYLFEAIGGRPPYRWRMVLGVEGFSIDPVTGLLSGQHAESIALPLAVHVSDSTGAEDSALYTLRIGKNEPLVITSTTLPTGTIGFDYEATLSASGGATPYAWSTETSLPEGFHLDPDSGTLSGLSPQSGFDQEIIIRVTDFTNQSVSSALALKIDTLFEITTPAQLPPAAPGAPYQLVFETEAGSAPFVWQLVEGTLPLSAQGAAWTLSPDGILSGSAPLIDSSHRFTLEARDSTGVTTRKSFQLPVRRSLIVVPSQGKAGLAWQPREIAQRTGSAARAYTVTRSLSPDGSAPQIVYLGAGNNFVDRGLAVGPVYYYSLHVHSAGGPPVVFATSAVTLLPFTTARGEPGRMADPHADAVKLFRPLSTGGHGSAFAPGNVTGPPDGRGTFAPASDPAYVLSLHARAGTPGNNLDACGGSIVLSFEDNIIEDTPGDDFTVFENVFFINGNPNQRFMEPAIVSVALFEDEWFRIPIDVVPPATTSSTPPTMDPFYYNRGFAGRNATTGGDPTDPRQSGGDSFDLSALKIPGLSWVRYIKIQSTGHNVLRDDFGGHTVQHPEILGATTGTGSSGFDLDAVTAAHY